jgi:hypothetical protein
MALTGLPASRFEFSVFTSKYSFVPNHSSIVNAGFFRRTIESLCATWAHAWPVQQAAWTTNDPLAESGCCGERPTIVR